MNLNTKQRAFPTIPNKKYVFLSDQFLLSNLTMKSFIFVIFLANIKARVLISIVYW